MSVLAPLARADAWVCELPLPHVLRLGPLTYETRDYVILRLRDRDGNAGFGVGYTRFTPLLESLHTLLNRLDPDDPDPLATSLCLRKQLIPGWAAMVRGASLIDLALWDLRSRATGTSVAAAMNPATAEPSSAVAAMAVAGYFADVRGAGAVLEEVTRFVEDGYSVIKVELPGVTPSGDLELLEQVRNVAPVGVRVAADFHGMFESTTEFEEYAERFHGTDLMFLEDPFSSLATESYRRLSPGAFRTPLAAGEDMATTDAYDDVHRSGIEYVRVDATTVGGLSDVARWATGAGSDQRLLPHVWPWAHDPLAAATHRVDAIEVIPEYVGAEPLWQVLDDASVPIQDGMWRTRSDPGLAWSFDPARLDRVAARREQLTFER